MRTYCRHVILGWERVANLCATKSTRHNKTSSTDAQKRLQRMQDDSTLCIVFCSIVMLYFRKSDSHFSSYIRKHIPFRFFIHSFRVFLFLRSSSQSISFFLSFSLSLSFVLYRNSLLFDLFKSYCNSFINFRLLMLLSFVMCVCAYRISFVRSFVRLFIRSSYHFFPSFFCVISFAPIQKMTAPEQVTKRSRSGEQIAKESVRTNFFRIYI